MRSDGRYTALLMARVDDYEFWREDLAPSKDNSTAHSSGRKKLACSTCGETTKIAYRRNAGTHERTGRMRYRIKTSWPKAYDTGLYLQQGAKSAKGLAASVVCLATINPAGRDELTRVLHTILYPFISIPQP